MATIDTIADRSTGSAIAGKAYFETSTNKFIVYNGSAWIEIDSDGTGAVGFENRWGASFDGSYYLDPGSNAFDSILSSSFTISLWYKSPSAFPQGDPTYGWAGAFLANKFIEQKGYLDWRLTSLNSSTDATIEIYYSPSAGSSGNYNTLGQTTSTVISPNTWYNITWTVDRSSGQSKLYIDGNSTTLTRVTPFLSSVPAGSFSADSNITIGMRNGSSSGDLFLTGGLDEVAIFSSALSAPEVASLIDSSGSNPVPADLSSFINNGLAAWYRMGDDSNDSPSSDPSSNNIATITDSSGNGNDITQSVANNQPTFKALDQSTTALSFDGGDYLNLNIPAGTLSTDFTMASWVKAPLTEDGPVFYNNYNAGSGVGWRMWKGSSGDLNFWASQNATNYHNAFSSNNSAVPDNIWTHLALVRSSGDYKVYVNGGEIALTLDSDTGFLSDSSDLGAGNIVGLFQPHTNNGMAGYADDTAIFNSALSASNIASLAASRGAHIINDLSLSPVAYYRMGEDDNLTDGQTGISQITDASGNGNHATQATASAQPTASIDPVIYV